MIALGASAESLQLRSVRLRGAADGLAARRRLEAALADVAPSSLPPQALLLVRRLAPAARLRLDPRARGEEFAQAVRGELKQTLGDARRPWLHADAGAAHAVLFADECELMACLLRDWLRGALAERWWWPSLLRGLSAPLWWRNQVLPRGDVLPAVFAHLATQDAAALWVARLDVGEVTQARAAIVAAHALSPVPEFADVGPAPAADSTTMDAYGPEGAIAEAAADAQRRLIALVPEMQAWALTRGQRQLLALGLGLQRASAWAHSAEFAAALRTLPDALLLSAKQDDVTAAVETIAEVTAADDAAPLAATPQGGSNTSDDSAWAAQTLAAPADHPATAPHLAPRRRAAAARLSARRNVDRRRPRRSRLQLQASRAPDIAPPAPANNAAITAFGHEPAQTRQSEPPRAELPASSPAAGVQTELSFLPAIETKFGGLFYLLNVALALGLYGDFTQPRMPGIALSPWDFLALVGRAWFGRAFERDPVRAMLGELAGRERHEQPGRGFAPEDNWVAPADWLAPWNGAARLKVYATGKRLQLWHDAGFIVIDVPRARGLAPLAQARVLCAEHVALRTARLTRAVRLPRERARRTLGRAPLGRWLRCLLLYLHARLARALGSANAPALAARVCRHRATLRCSTTRLDVHLSLADLPLALRIAGLDRDPGWIPAAGRTIAFHFA